MHDARLRVLKDAPVRPDARYGLYWMQAAQRTRHNPALAHAIEQANALDLPLVVCFGLAAFPDANARHYDFMLRGLAEVAEDLGKAGIAFVIRKSPPDRLALALSAEAAFVVCDMGYLRIQRAWRERLAADIGVRLVQVETESVVPVDLASGHHEYAARTLRPKIHRLWDDFIQPQAGAEVRRSADGLSLPSDVDLGDPLGVVGALKIDQTVRPVRRFEAGQGAARRRLEAFVADGLSRYAEERGRPEARAVSLLSPYLHFGQISPVEIALAVREAGSDGPGKYLEELIVRRELAMNHVWRQPDYDVYDALPSWALRTLQDHAADPRPFLYDRETLERSGTHDPVWNAAMLEMRATGYMHNHLRMYWGKKILQWSATPQEAFETILALNNCWFLDGRDPSSFTNVGWLFGLHDRPWGPQPVFGTVRSMGPNSLKKFDAEAYVRDVEAMAAAEDA